MAVFKGVHILFKWYLIGPVHFKDEEVATLARGVSIHSQYLQSMNMIQSIF